MESLTHYQDVKQTTHRQAASHYHPQNQFSQKTQHVGQSLVNVAQCEQILGTVEVKV